MGPIGPSLRLFGEVEADMAGLYMNMFMSVSDQSSNTLRQHIWCLNLDDHNQSLREELVRKNPRQCFVNSSCNSLLTRVTFKSNEVVGHQIVDSQIVRLR